MWDERYSEICRRHPDLVAVYESGHGRLGLLLRQTLVPLGAERMQWLEETRVVARQLIAELRAAGFSNGTVVLQWLPIHDVARIVARWVRRWDGDPARRSALLAVVERRLVDERFLAARAVHTNAAGECPLTTEDTLGEDLAGPGAQAPAIGATLNEAGLDSLKAWYAAMAPCWLAIQPARRRRLVLQTHVWIADLALSDLHEGPARALAELGPEGSLARALGRLAPGRANPWRGWIDEVRADLMRALDRPPALRTQGWARWLFFVPYRAAFPRRAPHRPFASPWTATPQRAKMEA
jgi:hypothetical protein